MVIKALVSGRGEWILGLGGASQDFSCALMEGGDIKVAVEEERLTRVKHGSPWWYQNPVRRSVAYCLDAAGIAESDVARVVSSDLLPYRARADIDPAKLVVYGHHLCHAASAYMMLPAGARAGIIVFDAMGSISVDANPSIGQAAARETISFFIGEEWSLRSIGSTTGTGPLEHTDFPMGVTNSIGCFYEMATAIMGFHMDDTGKLMGLAGHGKAIYADALRHSIKLRPDRSACLDLDPTGGGLVEEMEGILLRGGNSFAVRADLAASVQQIFTETLLHCYGLMGDERLDVLCVAGGCGLNSVANGELASALAPGTRLFVPPHVGDAGIAFGALWLDAAERRSLPHPAAMTFAGGPLTPQLMRPGQGYPPSSIADAVRAVYPRLVLVPTADLVVEIAKRLASGAVIGVFRGGSEIGPRALGGRSLLADPRDVRTKERINRLIKHREPFRPLAPMVASAYYSEYFEPDAARNPFMTVVARATERCVREVPAVVHVDGTARVQVVDDDTDPWLARLLEEFRARTGVAVLLNTSFNRKQEPIVESPAQAIDAFLEMKLDGLVLGSDLYIKADM